jgi:hypothetical protein
MYLMDVKIAIFSSRVSTAQMINRVFPQYSTEKITRFLAKNAGNKADNSLPKPCHNPIFVNPLPTP